MNEFRKKRMESLIMREISNLIMKRNQKDEDISLVSVTNASLASDYSTLKIKVSFFSPDEKQNQLGFRALQRHRIFFQNTLSRSLRLRLTPHLSFHQDTSLKEADALIEKIEHLRQQDSLESSSEQ